MSWIEGIEVPVIFSAVLTSLLTFQGLARLLLPEVDNDLFGFVHVQDQVATPANQLLHLCDKTIAAYSERWSSRPTMELHPSTSQHWSDQTP